MQIREFVITCGEGGSTTSKKCLKVRYFTPVLGLQRLYNLYIGTIFFVRHLLFNLLEHEQIRYELYSFMY